jgi:hypothetical protein
MVGRGPISRVRERGYAATLCHAALSSGEELLWPAVSVRLSGLDFRGLGLRISGQTWASQAAHVQI